MKNKQTHIRCFTQDKLKLDRFMKRNGIKSQVLAMERMFKRLK